MEREEALWQAQDRRFRGATGRGEVTSTASTTETASYVTRKSRSQLFESRRCHRELETEHPSDAGADDACCRRDNDNNGRRDG